MRKVFIEDNCKTIAKIKKQHMRKVFIEEYVKHREMENAEVQNLLYCIARVQHPH